MSKETLFYQAGGRLVKGDVVVGDVHVGGRIIPKEQIKTLILAISGDSAFDETVSYNVSPVWGSVATIQRDVIGGPGWLYEVSETYPIKSLSTDLPVKVCVRQMPEDEFEPVFVMEATLVDDGWGLGYKIDFLDWEGKPSTDYYEAQKLVDFFGNR